MKQQGFKERLKIKPFLIKSFNSIWLSEYEYNDY